MNVFVDVVHFDSQFPYPNHIARRWCAHSDGSLLSIPLHARHPPTRLCYHRSHCPAFSLEIEAVFMALICLLDSRFATHPTPFPVFCYLFPFLPAMYYSCPRCLNNSLMAERWNEHSPSSFMYWSRPSTSSCLLWLLISYVFISPKTCSDIHLLKRFKYVTCCLPPSLFLSFWPVHLVMIL